MISCRHSGKSIADLELMPQEWHSANYKEVPEMSHPELNKISYRTRWSFLLAIVPMLVAPLLLLSVNHAFAAQYLNSAEPMCSGSDSTVLMCDDFEDGAWYYYSGGQNDYATVNKGWKGESPIGPDPLGHNYGRCLPTYVGGAVGTNCSAESRNTNDGSGNQARHQFSPSATPYNEIYLRFYLFMPTGYNPYHHKLLSIGWNDALMGEQHIIVDLRTFADPIIPTGCIMVGTFPPDRESTNNCWLFQNQGNDLFLTTNKWYYLELHLKLNTSGQSNGVYEMWADECGTNGLGCTGPGTLRTRFTGGAGFREAGQIKTILFEAWQNPPFSGTRNWDQIVVRTTRIGPMGVTGGTNLPPAAPTNLRIQ